MKDKATQRTLERLVSAVDALTEEVQGMQEVMERIAAGRQSGEAAMGQSGEAAGRRDYREIAKHLEDDAAARQGNNAAEQRIDRAAMQQGRMHRKYGYASAVVDAFSKSGRVQMSAKDIHGDRRSTREFADALRKAIKRIGKEGRIEVQQRGDEVVLVYRYVIDVLSSIAPLHPDKDEFRAYCKEKGIDDYARDMGLI